MELLKTLLPDDVRDLMVAHVWQGAQAEIQLAVRVAIIQELYLDIHTRAQRHVQAELDKALGPAVEARLGEVKEVAERIVAQLFDRVDEEALARLEVAMTFHLDNLFDRAIRELAQALKQTFRDAITQSVDAYRRRQTESTEPVGRDP